MEPIKYEEILLYDNNGKCLGSLTYNKNAIDDEPEDD